MTAPAGPTSGESSSASARTAAADALAEAAQRVGDRWSLQVIGALLAGPRRFGDLQELLAGIAPNILSKRLERLEADGLIVGEPYSRRPVRHAYRLTATGADLAGALRMLAHWGAVHGAARPEHGDGGMLAHARCGTALDARWFCPTCEAVVDEDDSTDLRWI
ncbi:MAG: helix-turn-helix transcriptional regulator [Acidimicrobiales bacterium]|nr:helix-turn-helix transcriptional regulator [Acidimicrobiales bacterium]